LPIADGRLSIADGRLPIVDCGEERRANFPNPQSAGIADFRLKKTSIADFCATTPPSAPHKAISNGKWSREAGAEFKWFYICHLRFAICHLKSGLQAAVAPGTRHLAPDTCLGIADGVDLLSQRLVGLDRDDRCGKHRPHRNKNFPGFSQDL
jgi:hypothetical protein